MQRSFVSFARGFILIVLAWDQSRCRILSAVCVAKFHHPPETKHQQVVAMATGACVDLLPCVAGKTGTGWQVARDRRLESAAREKAS